jgi:hypothetical protein
MMVMSLSRWEGLFASTAKPARPSRSGFLFCGRGTCVAVPTLSWRRRVGSFPCFGPSPQTRNAQLNARDRLLCFARVRARYWVLVVGEEMKGLVSCNFLPGSARRLELGTVSAEPLSRAYWSQNSRRSAKRLACRARVLLAKVPIALKRAVGLSGPSSSRQSAPHPAAMVGTGMPKLRAPDRQ